MGRLRELLLRLWALGTRRRDLGREDLVAELRFHREMLESDLRRQGSDDDAARLEAARRLGGPAQVIESYGDQRSLPALESLIQDARYAIRTFVRAPGFSLAALLTLAIGIGATTAIFSVVNAVLLRPLPFANAERLIMFGDSASRDSYGTIGYATFADFRDRSRSLEQLAAIRSWQTTLVTSEAERLPGMRVSWNYFSVLGVQPALGRTFRREEDHPDRYRVLVLSGLWRRRFNADPGVIGRTFARCRASKPPRWQGRSRWEATVIASASASLDSKRQIPPTPLRPNGIPSPRNTSA